MSVCLEDVLINAGYDIRHNTDDAYWLLSQAGEFEDLYAVAENLVENRENEDEQD